MLWLLREREFETVHPCQWMLRVVDAPAGIATRLPAGRHRRRPSRSTTRSAPPTRGHWRLKIANGGGRLGRSSDQPPP
ncbi:hypothetical protein [Actinomadura madurae]|uniref:hypothetical protein n=1 Tax=Actinomadura madurae TaxID=1993 RepID=UPI0020D24735|nr:hypothetical protein [Actinomadura madurae]MCP9956017.1 hypothetical protein [Actinomadura madurae]MCP9972710.1 hypothetical protein [Actinomadura madurae]MCP9985273.1 hypothetical protein [Actinomadura madurae]MCQ0012301.1 hypothetical protein [Actinomadura madurae]MCQ0012358.1 hypothetical protein [Actinomadura madurae]